MGQPAAHEVAVGERRDQPLARLHHEQQQHAEELRRAPAPRRRGLQLRRMLALLPELLEALGELAQASEVVDVGDRHRGEALAQCGDELGGRQ